MRLLHKTLKPLLALSFLCSAFTGPLYADDSSTTIGDLSARIEELEHQLSGKAVKTNDENPGSQVTHEDLDRLRDEMRSLGIDRIREDIQDIREQVRRLEKRSHSPTSSDESKTPFESPEAKPSSKTKGKSSPATDEETESVLKLLEQSAPGTKENQDDEEETPKKKSKKDKELEIEREAATHHAEEKAPTLPTGDAEAQYNQAFTLHEKGEYKKAERAFDSFIKTYPKDPLMTQAMYGKADCYLKQGKYKEAKALFVSTYKKNPKGPKAPDCLLRLGEALALENKKEDACTAWRKLATDFPPPHKMTRQMQTELASLKKKHKCE